MSTALNPPTGTTSTDPSGSTARSSRLRRPRHPWWFVGVLVAVVVALLAGACTSTDTTSTTGSSGTGTSVASDSAAGSGVDLETSGSTTPGTAPSTSGAPSTTDRSSSTSSAPSSSTSSTTSTTTGPPDDATGITPGNEAFCDRMFQFGLDVADLQNADISDLDTFSQQFMELYKTGFEELAALAPEAIKADLELFAGAIRQAQTPDDLANFDGPTYDEAATRIEDWIVANCGFSMDDF